MNGTQPPDETPEEKAERLERISEALFGSAKMKTADGKTWGDLHPEYVIHTRQSDAPRSISRGDAEAVVRREYSIGWGEGTFMIGEVREDADYFAFTVGAREWLIDRNDAYVVDGSLPIFINKATGQEELPPGVGSAWEAVDRFTGMTLLEDFTAPDPSEG